ncbi:MAG: phage protein Gp36 family protein [Gemmatimonadota bacterium]|nr:phage protein Gp36 family protein [Gemmatimonadota bacterium]
MAYSTITDLTRWIEHKELIRLCTTDSQATIESESVIGVVGEVIESADAQIDGCLLGRWPGLRDYDPVPDEINRLSAMIAIYNLYLRRRAVSESWRRCYEDCTARLEAAAKGHHSLGLDDQGTLAGSGGQIYRTDTREEDRAFTDEKLEKF